MRSRSWRSIASSRIASPERIRMLSPILLVDRLVLAARPPARRPRSSVRSLDRRRLRSAVKSTATASRSSRSRMPRDSRHRGSQRTVARRNTWRPRNSSRSCARRGRDGLDQAAVAADHDRALPLPLHQDGGEDAHQLALRIVLPRVDQHGGGERQLVAGVAQHLLADALGDQEALGMERDQLRVVERRSFRQPRPQLARQQLDAVAVERRERHDLLEQPAVRVARHQRQQRRLLHQVDLVERQQPRRVDAAQQLEQVLIAAAERHRRRRPAGRRRRRRPGSRSRSRPCGG